MIKTHITLFLFEKIVDWQYTVPNLKYSDLDEIIASEELNQYVIFDTRSMEEYETSHIRQAIQLDPTIIPEDFDKKYSEVISNKHVVFYCSVGYRSSAILQQLQEVSLKAGAISLQNLRGGIFRWYNEDLQVINEDGITNEIHPYDTLWGFLLKKRD